jgi:hypothetical protein
MQQTYQFNLTQDEANIILNGLGELPSKVSMNLITNLIQQFAAQNQETQQELPLEA